jgi:hypothetical protein
LLSASKNTPQPVITQTLRTEARMRHPQGGAIFPAVFQLAPERSF